MKKHTIAAFLALLLALVFALPAAAEAQLLLPEPLNAPETRIISSALEDDGVVRVYLKSLARPRNLTLSMDGVYTVEHDAGFRFERGMQLVLSEDGGKIWLCAGGLRIDMGSSLVLTRQASDEEENGLRIGETGRDTLYMGDLAVSCEEGGGLRAVLAINMEDYLCGVVAYEMNNSWPIEALKAQAVAARTYAMQRKWSAGTRDYDVVDTTADQVFRGYNAEYANVLEAVRATEGVVGTYKGGFATCYYTASNGGQTAMPEDVWTGSGDYGYLARTADPYDLENEHSIVNSVTFNDDASNLPALKKMLKAGLKEAARKQGISTSGLEMEQILSIEPVEPIAQGSLMNTKLRFTLSASAPRMVYLPSEGDIGAPVQGGESKSADLALYTIDQLRRLLHMSPYALTSQRTVLDEKFTVDLDVYSQIKDELDLSIQSNDCEIVSIVDGLFEFTIEMRRYGHGVGMSQRGAQTMAGDHGKSWLEILKFYYPGMTLERIEWNTPKLEAIEDLKESIGAARPAPTPTPTPAPLPALQPGEYYARVHLEDTSTNLNMREMPTTQSQVLTQLASGRRVIVCSEADADGWVSIKTAEYSGWCKLEYLVKE